MEEIITQIEQLKEDNVKKDEEINDLKRAVELLQDSLNSLLNNESKESKESKESTKDKFIKKEDNNNNLSIVFSKYKKSIMVKNMYDDKYTTIKCKEVLKELGAKWSKNSEGSGWLLVGQYNDNKSMEENVEFIVEKLNGQYILDYKLDN